MTHGAVFFEELAANAHPSLRTQLYDGWVLRFSNGYTKRANSVHPLYPSTLPLEEKVAFCECAYAAQGLPTIFKMTDALPAALDAYLAERGYERVAPTNLWIKENLSFAGEEDAGVSVSEMIDSEWKTDFFRMNGVADPDAARTASAMMENICGSVLCAKIVEAGETIACGLGVVERGTCGMYDIVVGKGHRRKGHGRRLCEALLAKAARVGVSTAYLQVVADNAPALALYTGLGFEHAYGYWYRVRGATR